MNALPRLHILFLLLCLLLAGFAGVQAGVLDEIGYTDLCNELGDDLPNSEGMASTQVEAKQDNCWMPDASHADFSGKTITDQTGGDTGASSHATGVGRRFYGNAISMAPAIATVNVYETDDWLLDGFLRVDQNSQPASPSAPVANHSWVGRYSTANANSIALRRLDWIIETHDTIEVAGLTNSPASSRALLSSAYNVITVGKTNGSHSRQTASLDDSYDDIYQPVRVRPHLVVPLDTTSAAAPVGASAAALLLDAGSGSAAEKSEVIRAALMAGADRYTPCSCDVFLGDYRARTETQTDNGLDARYGSGQLNIYNSYHIVAAGEQGPGSIATAGYDYSAHFGGEEGSGNQAIYSFTADNSHTWLCASLAWNLDIDGGLSWNFNGYATFYDLDLALYNVTRGSVVAASASPAENTENLWVPLTAGHSYELRVRPGDGQGDFLWDYGLAWRLVPDPEGDGDGDGMPDNWEAGHGLDAADPQDGLADPDNDQLTSRQEYCLGTSPGRADTDGDGINDGAELELWGGSCGDADGDGLANLVDPDADGDGINDGPEKDFWAADWNSDPDGDDLINLLDVDSDNDTVPDGFEIKAGSDPADAASFPEATPVPAAGPFSLIFGVCILFLLMRKALHSA